MTERYEMTRSRGEESLKLIFPEGMWESLPFEVRLSRPWYGGEVCDRTGITTRQFSEIAKRGYCIAAVQPFEPEKVSIGNFKPRSATSPILIPILGLPCGIQLLSSGATSQQGRTFLEKLVLKLSRNAT